MKAINVAIVAMLLFATFLLYTLSVSVSQLDLTPTSTPALISSYFQVEVYLPLFLVLAGLFATILNSKIAKVLSGGYLLIFAAATLSAASVSQAVFFAATYTGVGGSSTFYGALVYGPSFLLIYLLMAASGVALISSGVRKGPSPSVLSGVEI